MSVYQPNYTDKQTGKTKTSEFWWIDFTIGGKRIRESAETTRKTIAIQYEKNRRHDLERALAGMPMESAQKRISTAGELVKEYLGHYHLNHRPASVTFAKARLAHASRLLGNVLLSDLTEDRIRGYIKARLSENGRGEQPISGRTINMELGELSRAVGKKWAELWPKVRKMEENRDVGQALTPDQEGRLLAAAATDESPNRNPCFYPFLCISLSTGMRSGEIKSLRWYNVNLDGSILTVGRSKTKGGAGRQIPINGDLRSIMDEHAAWYRRKVGDIQPDWYVFPGRIGKPQRGEQRPLDPTKPVGNMADSWDALRDRCGVRCRLHDLRHTAATKMAEAGVPESTMLAIMGHMSRAMLERYSHIRMLAKREAVKSLELPKAGLRAVPTPMSNERQSGRKGPESICVSA